ncbi:Uncharacterised protein [Yersinia pekkanenii]|uniref:Uncharacterized protein n=1 Tax=Yersinia pekkanenii TaxID=1288385 RepID=A0A0T9PAW6_9GAMM|nr:Uncharacterised protein [Yersinia pekkanenii]CRY67501.1 Uncharacterised protein [Yersinia pekkanenii]
MIYAMDLIGQYFLLISINWLPANIYVINVKLISDPSLLLYKFLPDMVTQPRFAP